MFKLCVVIVTWNNQDDIVDCLQSIFYQQLEFEHKIIIVDNASTDKTVYLASQFKNVDIIKNKKNIYLSPANNQGIKYAIKHYDPEYIMVLNPDTVLGDGLIKTLLNTFENQQDLLAVGPKVVFYKNKLQGRINSAGLYFDGFAQAYDIGFEEVDNGQYNYTKNVFGVSGVCILYNTKLLKQIGYYWEQIKMYYDEIELFIRASKAGLKVIYNGSVCVYHKWMQSVNKNKSLKLEFYKKLALLKIAFRHYSFRSKLSMLKNFLAFLTKYIWNKIKKEH